MTNYRKARRWIAKAFPTTGSVTVKIVSRKQILDESDGTADETTAGYLIRIAADLSETTKIDTMMHEWSHIMVWDKTSDNYHHNPAWQRQYGAITAAYEAYKGNP